MYKIFYVDDELTNRLLFKRLSRELGVSLDVAESGMEALVMLNSNSYDLMFFDHIMPNMSGVELYESLKSIGDNPNINTPCVVLTGNTMEGAAEMYREKGFAEYIKKPVDPAALRNVVEKYLPGVVASEMMEDYFEIPEYLRTIPGIAASHGMKMNGSLETYIYSIEVYQSIAEKRRKEIENAFRMENWDSYQILVHSLKSAAEVIGAMELSNAAFDMEKAALSGDYEKIKLRQSEFMLKYVTLMNRLEQANIPASEDMRAFRRFEEEQNAAAASDAPKNVLIVCDKESVTLRSMMIRLKEDGFRAFRCHAYSHEFESMKDMADIYVYVSDGNPTDADELYDRIKSACQEKVRCLLIIGNMGEQNYYDAKFGKSHITSWIQTPMVIEEFSKEVNRCYRFLNDGDKRKTLLLVDDDEMYVRMVKNWLEEEYNVLTAHSGAMAISELAKNSVDAILLDYEMPIVNGPKSFEIICEDEANKNIPIIFLTGNQDRKSVSMVQGLDLSGYIIKNSGKETLKKKVRESI